MAPILRRNQNPGDKCLESNNGGLYVRQTGVSGFSSGYVCNVQLRRYVCWNIHVGITVAQLPPTVLQKPNDAAI